VPQAPTEHARWGGRSGSLAALAPRCGARRVTRHFPQVNSSEIHPGALGISRQAFWLIRSGNPVSVGGDKLLAGTFQLRNWNLCTRLAVPEGLSFATAR
jgi:hypothetical protein